MREGERAFFRGRWYRIERPQESRLFGDEAVTLVPCPPPPLLRDVCITLGWPRVKAVLLFCASVAWLAGLIVGSFR